MSLKYIPNESSETMTQMLKELGLRDLYDLFKDVTVELMLKRNLHLPPPVSEYELKELVAKKLRKNRVYGEMKVFLGGGVYIIDVPSIIPFILSRGELLTAYTPYQPEASQGTLQSLFEYQSLICELTGMEVANCSMYDYGTAAAEAILMSSRVTNRFKVILAENISPFRRRVIETYISPKMKIVDATLDIETGGLNIESLKLDQEVSCLYIEIPSFIGSIEHKIEEISEIVHRNGSLLIVGVDPISLGILKPPGELGADVVVGEGQVLGNSLNFGGPLLGIFAVRGDLKLVRQMPGRVVGMTRTKNGIDRAFTNILQTREQHIRREKATSNICTNEALTAIASAIYLSLLGKTGFKRLAESIAYKSHYVAGKLSEQGASAPPFKNSFFREILVRFPPKIDVGQVVREGLANNMIVGLDVSELFPKYSPCLLTAVYETHTKKDLDDLVDFLSRFLR